MAAIRLPKSFWGEILKTVAYLKNRSLSQKGFTPYKRANEKKPNLKYLLIVDSRAWVHVPEKLRKKLNDRAWQGIFVGCEGRNLYRIYHPLTGKIHKTRDDDMDEGLLHDKSEVNPWKFVDAEWDQSDDSLFADPLEFDEEQPGNNPTSTPNSGRKDADSPKSGEGGDDVESLANDSNHSNIELALTSVPDHIESPPRRSKRNFTERVLYPCQMVYRSGPLPKVNTKVPEVSQSSSSANFVTSRTAKSHEHMV